MKREGDALLNLTLDTKRTPADVRARLQQFFEVELGLARAKDTDDEIGFTGGGGYVTAKLSARDAGTTVELLTIEWDEQVRRFAREGL